MNERDSPLDLEPNEETLREAWKALAEALVLFAEDVEPTGDGEDPIRPDGPQPYIFTHHLDISYASKHLLVQEEGSYQTVKSAEVAYLTPRKLEPDDTASEDVVSIDWRSNVQYTDFLIDHSIVIVRQVMDGSGIESWRGYIIEQYVESLPGGNERAVSRTDYEYRTNPTYEDKKDALADTDKNYRAIDLDGIETMRKIAEYLRSKPRMVNN